MSGLSDAAERPTLPDDPQQPLPLNLTHAYRTVATLALIAFLVLVVSVYFLGILGDRITGGLDSACADAAFTSGKQFEALGNDEEALRLFRQALQGHFSQKADEYLCARSIGEILFRQGRYAEAVQVFQNLPDEAFPQAGTLAAYATSLWRNGHIQQAQRIGKKWLAMAQAENEPQQQIWANHMLGLICREQAQPDKALQYLRAAAALDPANEANLAIAEILLDQQQPQQALRQLDTLLQHVRSGPLYENARRLRQHIPLAASGT